MVTWRAAAHWSRSFLCFGMTFFHVTGLPGLLRSVRISLQQWPELSHITSNLVYMASPQTEGISSPVDRSVEVGEDCEACALHMHEFLN